MLAYLATCPVPFRKSFYRKWCRRHRNESFTIKTLDDFKMRLTAGDSVANQLIVFKEYEPTIATIVKDAARKGLSFVDVGCNVGYFSLLFAKYSKERVVAIDANPTMVEQTKFNGLLNGFSIEVFHAAIGDSQGQVCLSWDNHAESHACLGGNYSNQIEVEMTTLPNLLKGAAFNKKALLKVDIEGYEIPLLRALEGFDFFEEILFEFSKENIQRCGFTVDELWQLPFLKNYTLLGLSSKRPGFLSLEDDIDTIYGVKK